MADIKMLHVPYRGALPALNDVIAGHVDMFFDTATTSVPMFRSGQIKIIAVGSTKRIPALAEVPWVPAIGDGAASNLGSGCDSDRRIAINLGTSGAIRVLFRAERVEIPVIASGGAGSLEHLYQGLTAGGASAALVASLFHYGEHTVREAKAYLSARGVAVRL